MLAVARRRLAKEPEAVRERVQLKYGDMMSTALPTATYRLAIIAFSSIYHVSGEEERKKVYINCRSALAQGGALVVDNSFYPRCTDSGRAMPTLQRHGDHVLPDGTPFRLEIRTQPPWPSTHYSRTLLLRSPGGALIHEREIHMEYVPPDATVAELRKAGFDRVDTYDGYSTVTVTPDLIRSRQVFVAHL